MGQEESCSSGGKKAPQSDVLAWLTISWDEFVENIQKLNVRCMKNPDSNGNYLRFVIRKGTEVDLLWKATVRIGCLKMAHNSMQSRRILTLRQFLKLYSSLEQLMVDLPPDGLVQPCCSVESLLTSSYLLDTSTNSDGDCAICMERMPDTILPCAHTFCLVCIEQWKETGHKWCPLCHHNLSGTQGDSWEMVNDVPQRDQVLAYLVSSAD